eukprot:IDg10523t1
MRCASSVLLSRDDAAATTPAVSLEGAEAASRTCTTEAFRRRPVRATGCDCAPKQSRATESHRGRRAFPAVCWSAASHARRVRCAQTSEPPARVIGKRLLARRRTLAIANVEKINDKKAKETSRKR